MVIGGIVATENYEIKDTAKVAMETHL